jgi:hypothetical protein
MLGRSSARQSGHRVTPSATWWIELITRSAAPGCRSATSAVRRLVREGAGNEAERLALLLRTPRGRRRQLAEVTGSPAAIDQKIAIYENASPATP